MIVAQFDLELKQMEVKITFLYDELEEKIYMKQPEGYIQEGKENKVCLLKKSLYGLSSPQAVVQMVRLFHDQGKI